VQLTHTDRTALGHLEDRIAGLVRRLDASDARFGLLEGVERGLADLLVYVEQLRATNTASAAVSAIQPSAVAAPAERASTVARPTERSRPAERPKQNEQVRPTERAKPTEQFTQAEQVASLSLHEDLFDDSQAISEDRADRARSRVPEEQSEYSTAMSALAHLSGPAAAPV